MEKIGPDPKGNKVGFVLGSFCPPHTGHVALWDFAGAQVDLLIVSVCARPDDEINGVLRLGWVEEILTRLPHAFLLDFVYDKDAVLPWGKEGSSRDASKVWAAFYATRFALLHPQFIFSSEDYGDYMAEYMGITHIPFDKKRIRYPVSSRSIRKAPIDYEQFIPAEVRKYYRL